MEKLFFVLLVFSGVYVNYAKEHPKAFYCRDPDTGMLHAVNTSWASSSFCGNYTCNIRRKNDSVTSTTPIRQFNFTYIPSQTTNTTEEAIKVTIEKKTVPEIQPLLHKIVSSRPRNIIETTVTETTNKTNETASTQYHNEEQERPQINCCNNSKDPNSSAENDRYLTENEIDNITSLLHTIKRSDLDAIVDIYKLAQDIYKEIDDISSDEIKMEALNIIRDEEIHKNREVGNPSYWYDPLVNKGGMDDRLDTNIQNIPFTYSGMPSVTPKSLSTRHFKEGSLRTNNEFTPFYYPVTQFQRISSYTHPAYSSRVFSQNTNTTKGFEVTRQDIQTKNTAANSHTDSQKLIEPTHYLPYPFANMHPYNLNETRNNYFSNPWVLNYYNRYKYYTPSYGTYQSPVQKAVLVNPHLYNEIQDVEAQTDKQSVELKKENKAKNRDSSVDILLFSQDAQKWKTGPIPKEVLKDIRADIDTSKLIKAFPFRRKIKLERVGKLMNMDALNSHVNRNKRYVLVTEKVEDNTTVLEEYETYLEKVTCRDQVELGYFRIGNLTLPYPGCCPQLINTR